MLADDLDTGIHIHLNESLTEVENSKERFGRRPTEVAYDCGILYDRCIAAHCVWLSDAEIALMRETGTQISHNPSSNAKLGNGIARVPEMLAAGINVGLGHDAAECNNSRDLFEVMKFASLIHRASRVDPSLQQAPDVVRMATRNGSAALGTRPASCHGRQEGGRDPRRPAEPDVHAALSPRARRTCTRTWCSPPTAAPCNTTIIDGKVVYDDREFTTIDEPKVLHEANDGLPRRLDRMVVPS